jgi:hypothetical protein
LWGLQKRCEVESGAGEEAAEEAFHRMRITSHDDQADFLSQVRTALQSAPPDEAVDRSF